MKKATIAKVTAGKKKLTVKMKAKATALGGDSYQISYRVKGTSKWKTLSTSAQTRVIKKLKKGKKYQVRVRVMKTADGTKYYGAWSKVKTSEKIK